MTKPDNFEPHCLMTWREMCAGADSQLCAAPPVMPPKQEAQELSPSMQEHRARGLAWLESRARSAIKKASQE